MQSHAGVFHTENGVTSVHLILNNYFGWKPFSTGHKSLFQIPTATKCVYLQLVQKVETYSLVFIVPVLNQD